MKRRFLKKAISLLLALALLMPMAPPAFTAEVAGEENQVILSEPNEGLPGVGAGGSDAELFGGGFGGWTLKTLAGSTLSSVVGIGMNKAFGAIFGSDTDEILRAIDGLSKQLDDINNRIGEMQKAIQKDMQIKDLNDVLNEYRGFIGDYHELYALLNQKQKSFADDPALSKEFLLRVHDGNDATYRIKGDGVLSLTASLKSTLLTVKEVNGQKCNIFGALDLLERQKNRWEHQGYADRKAFRGAAIGIYTEFAALAKIACVAKMGDCQARGDMFGYFDAAEDLKKLEKDMLEVQKMVERCAVIEHPDLRVFRDFDTGWVYPFYNEVHVAQMTDPAGKSREFLASDDYIKSMTPWGVGLFSRGPDSGGGIHVYSTQPPADYLQMIYKSYGGHKSMYHIFFSPQEGDFENIGGLPKDTSFATSAYYYKELIMPSHGLYIYKWTTNLIDNWGNLYSKELMNNPNYCQDKFFSIRRFNGPLNPGALYAPAPLPENETNNMISGMGSYYTLPCSDTVTLAVAEKAGAKYQWFIDESGSGEKFEEIPGATSETYTLPQLEVSMNGYMYRCATIQNEGRDESDYTLAGPVTLSLVGEGIPALVTEHQVGNAVDLKAALDQVADGSWNRHTLQLTDNITYPHPITLADRHVKLDLHGHTLTVQPPDTAEPNVYPDSNKSEIAAVYVQQGSLEITGNSTGAINVIAGDGIAYGVYAGEYGIVAVNDVTSGYGGTAVYADGGQVVTNGVSAQGDDACAIQCFGGSYVRVYGNVTADGTSSCGVYAESYDKKPTQVLVREDITVSGENSQGAHLGAKDTKLTVGGSVTVTGGSAGVAADGSTVIIVGNITAPVDAVSAWDGADVTADGDIKATGESAAAVSVAGGTVYLKGNVTATGKGGTGINASAWDLVDPIVGANVTVDGKISAPTPLRIESLPVEENERTDTTTKEGYNTFTDGINTVWAKPGSFNGTISGDNFKDWPPKTNKPRNEPWRIDFSQAVNTETVTADTIYAAFDAEGIDKITGIGVQVNPTNQTQVVLTPPIAGWPVGEECFVIIKSTVKSATGQGLNQSVRLKFTAVKL